MIEKRLVQWYASDSGVDLDIAEREIALTYVLRILADQGILAHRNPPGRLGAKADHDQYPER